MTLPIHKNKNPDLTIFIDPLWLIASEKYLISHALEAVLTKLSSEQSVQRKIDEFVSSFSNIYQLTEYDVNAFCTRLKKSMPEQHTTKRLELISLRNTVSSYITQNFDHIGDFLYRSFEFKPTKFDMLLHQELLCSGLEYAVNNIRKHKSIIMITGSPAKTECQNLIKMAAKRKVKIHVLFATDRILTQHDDIQFYQDMTKALRGQFFELRRGVITEMELERIFRSIITPTNLATTWSDTARKPGNRYSYLVN